MQPYSLDLRNRVVAALRQPKSRQAVVAERFGVSVASIKKLLAHERQTGSLAPKPASGGRARYLDVEAQHWLVSYVGEHPGSTLAELSQAWLAHGGRPVGQICLWQVLDEHDLRRKKSLHASERDTPRVVAQRQDFVETVAQHYDTRRFHFLDETGLRLDACRRYARATGGQRVGQAVPLKRGASLTLIGTLSPQGLGAVQLFEGALNYEHFALYVSQFLTPTLRADDVLVLDNLAVHKIGGLREWLAERKVQVLFLPPYSPDFSPIEQAWSKLKTAVRTAQARSRQALEEAVQAAVDCITSTDVQHWFDHCGYHVQAA